MIDICEMESSPQEILGSYSKKAERDRIAPRRKKER